jgi:uncharacterized protein
MSAENNPQQASPTALFLISLGKLFFTVVLVLFVSNFIALGLALPLVNFDVDSLATFMGNPLAYPNEKMILMQMQGVISILTFAVAPLLYVKYFDDEVVKVTLNPQETVKPILFFITPLLVLFFMPFSSWLIEWNQHIAFPDFLAHFEQWAKAMDNGIDFLVAILVLALVPAIGEEILFRGVLQNKIYSLAKNIHMAIWVASFIFSAVHFQFYGFVPRLLLGVLFGYLYHWSGNLYIPTLAHFINNAFTLLLMYMHQQKIIAIDIETGYAPPEMAVFSFLLVCLFMYLFKKLQANDKKLLP